jgi:predicted ferric reductase
MKKGVFIITCLLITTAALWVFSKNGTLIAQFQSQPYLTLSQIFALWSVVTIGFSFLLSIRTRWLAVQLGGMDKVVKLHMSLGGLNFGLVIWHPILLILQALPNRQAALGYLWPAFQPWLYGALSLYGFLLVLVFALYIKIKYPLWRTVHDLLIIPLILVGLHTLTVTSDVSRSSPLKLWLLLWIVLGIVSFVYKRFIAARLLLAQRGQVKT